MMHQCTAVAAANKLARMKSKVTELNKLIRKRDGFATLDVQAELLKLTRELRIIVKYNARGPKATIKRPLR